MIDNDHSVGAVSPQRREQKAGLARRILAFVQAQFIPKYTLTQYVSYLTGCVVFTFGANCFIFSHLGTDPLDVLSLALREKLGITIGMAQGGLAIVFLAAWSLWNRRIPPISPFITFALCGSLIDIWMYSNVAAAIPIGSYGMLILGVSACAYGSALIVMSGIGIRPMDLLAITASKKLKIPFWCCKGVLEVVLLTSGWLLGGPVGLGTLVFLAFVGWFIQPLMWLSEVWLRIPNYGLPRQLPRSVVLN